jgi:ribonuclease Z
MKMSRRNMLKVSGGAVGGLVLGNALNSFGRGAPLAPGSTDCNQNSFFNALPVFPLGEPLDPWEMRVTFLGTSCIPRLAQECNSVFVETGSGPTGKGDQFVFDLGTGVIAKYNAMGIQMSRMDKIFLTHLHGDHTSDLIHLYCFGPSEDRKSPMYIFGPKDTNDWVYKDPDQNTRGPYADGTRTFCENLRNLMRWHTESFSFGPTRYEGYVVPTKDTWGLPEDPTPVGDDPVDDGYAIVPIELDWTQPGIAYKNDDTGVKITHFPAIHCRRGSMSFKLEWNNLSMIFSGDTKPNKTMISMASGVDLLVHEMVMPAYVWAQKNSGVPGPPSPEAVNYATEVQNSSHTPQGAFGYMLSQMIPPPRLAVATHFQACDDTIASAIKSVRNHYPTGELAFAMDLMVINVSKDTIRQRRAEVSDFAFYPYNLTDQFPTQRSYYWKWADDAHTKPAPDPYAQIILDDQVPAVNPDTGAINYRTDGY